MWYYITYYIKKFWYVITFIFLLLFLGIVIYMNRGDLITYFEKFENKIIYAPSKYETTSVDNAESYLDKLKVGAPYLGSSLTPYVPSSISVEEEDEFLRKMKEDPFYVYRKKISWANSYITDDEFTELMELVGYHLNKNSVGNPIIVNRPTAEQLQEYNQKVMYYTDDKGTLYMNLYVEEISVSSNVIKSYVYTYRLKYDMEGKVTIN